MTELAPDVAPWVKLLPDDVPDDYIQAVKAEASASARRDQIAVVVHDLEARINHDGAADLAVDPATLAGLSAELAGARALASVLPPIVPVPQSVHDAVAAMLPRPNMVAYRLPSPPAYLGELVHHQRAGHARNGDLPPQPTELDIEAIKAYEVVAAQAAAAWSSLSLFDTAPRGPMGDYVRAWFDTIHDDRWPALREALNDLIEMVNAADDARPPSGSCQWGRHSELRLQPAQLGDGPWSFASAVRDGIILVAPPMRDGVLLPVS